jgi:hypothetical protein
LNLATNFLGKFTLLARLNLPNPYSFGNLSLEPNSLDYIYGNLPLRGRKWIPRGEDGGELYPREFLGTLTDYKYLKLLYLGEFISIHILFSRGRNIHPSS